MNKEISAYMEKYTEDVQELFGILYEMILNSCNIEIEEKMWANMPSFYCGNNFIRLIPFKKHINVEASAIKDYLDDLDGYTVTPKKMLKVEVGQVVPTNTLELIFHDTLS